MTVICTEEGMFTETKCVHTRRIAVSLSAAES